MGSIGFQGRDFGLWLGFDFDLFIIIIIFLLFFLGFCLQWLQKRCLIV